MSFFPRKCPSCRERHLDLVTESYEAELEHDGRTYQIAIPSLTLLACSACGNRILPDEADNRVSEELRRVAGLLSPSEIRSQRTNLNLTQKQLSRDLDIAEETLSRWETGAQIQQRGFDKLLRAYFALPTLRNYFSHERSIPNAQDLSAESPDKKTADLSGTHELTTTNS